MEVCVLKQQYLQQFVFGYCREQLLWHLNFSSNVSYFPSKLTKKGPLRLSEAAPRRVLYKKIWGLHLYLKRVQHRIPPNTYGRQLLLCVTASIMENFVFYIKFFRKFASGQHFKQSLKTYIVPFFLALLRSLPSSLSRTHPFF